MTATMTTTKTTKTMKMMKMLLREALKTPPWMATNTALTKELNSQVMCLTETEFQILRRRRILKETAKEDREAVAANGTVVERTAKRMI